MALVLIVPAALQATLRTAVHLQRSWLVETQTQQLLHKLSYAKTVQKTPSVTEVKLRRCSSVTVMLQSCKKASLEAKILSLIILSSHAHVVASGCYFWQKSWFSDDCYTKKGHLSSDTEPFPPPSPWFRCYKMREGMSPATGKSPWHLNPLIGRWNQWSTINPHSN